MLSRLIKDKDQREALLQIVRFGVSGLFLTLLVYAAYLAGVYLFSIDPNSAFTFAFIIVMMLGYVLHSRWSFKNHGARDRTHIRLFRFATTSFLGFLSNQFFVWLIVKQLHLPAWLPGLPIIFVTPLLTFTLNRKWVFA